MMIGAEREAEFGGGSVEGRLPAIEYSLAALDEIVRAVVEGFESFPYGGVEVGGVLFGKREGNAIRILAARPLACEYASGPGFVLSQKDESALSRLLGEYASDPSLCDLVPVGWYHSHTRSEISISEKDLEIWNRHYPQPWQVAMVLQPRGAKPVRIGFFIRDPDGSVRTEASYREFEAEPASGARQATEPEEAQPAEPASPAPLPVQPEQAEPPVVIESPELSLTLARGRSRQLWIGLLIALCLLVAGGAVVVPNYWPKPATPVALPTLSLRVVEKNGQTTIQWSPTAKAIREATAGWLEIVDGAARVVIPLDPALLRNGSFPIVRRSADMEARLKVQPAGAAPVQEVARFLGRLPADGGAKVAGEPLPGMDQVRLEAEKLRATLARQLAEKARLDRQLKNLKDRAKPARVASSPPKAPPVRQAAAPPRVLRAPIPPLASHRQPALVPSPPELSPQPAAVGSGLPQSIRPLPAPVQAPPPATQEPSMPERTLLPKPSAPASAVPEAAKSAPPAYRGPSSGKLIWTGFLPKDSVLSIEGQRVSTGHLTGELPGLPLRIGAHPAELSGGGLTVYSSNPKYSRGSVTEPPGPQNGWNRTVYRYDPRQAREVIVVEAPGPQNGWYRILLRSGARPVSVIVLEWEITP
jgi:proteasome lid subunit RPN8/RPN11